MNIADFPDLRPSLLIDFASGAKAHPLLSFSRASSATCTGPDGNIKTVPAGVPRIDYDAAGKCLGYRYETSRTNLLTQSESMWSLTAAEYAAEQSDDVRNIYGGAGGVAKFRATAASIRFARKSVALAAGPASTSVFIYVPAQAGLVSWRFNFDFTDADQVFTETMTVFDRWLRVQTTTTLTANRTWIDFNILANGAVPTAGFTFYAMGMQCELAATVSSYVKTEDSAASRATDIANFGQNGRGAWSDRQGALLLENTVETSTPAGTGVLAMFRNSAQTSLILLREGAVIGGMDLEVRSGGSTVQYSGRRALSLNTQHKFALGWSNEKTGFSLDGQAVSSTTGSTYPLAQPLTELQLGGGNGWIHRVALFMRNFPDSVLQRLAT